MGVSVSYQGTTPELREESLAILFSIFEALLDMGV